VRTGRLVLPVLMGLASATLLGASAFDARAEFPVAVRGSVGLGEGGGSVKGRPTGAFGSLGAMDFAWRNQPGRAYVLSYVEAVESPGKALLMDPELGTPAVVENATMRAVLIGVERSRPGAGISPYLQASLGLGRVTADIGNKSLSGLGLALDGCAGLRIVPAPGPVGLLLALRTTSVVSGEARGHVWAGTLGLTLHPR
jgi:hypothetical protein